MSLLLLLLQLLLLLLLLLLLWCWSCHALLAPGAGLNSQSLIPALERPGP